MMNNLIHDQTTQYARLNDHDLTVTIIGQKLTYAEARELGVYLIELSARAEKESLRRSGA